MVTADSPGSTGLVFTQKKLILNQTMKHKDNATRFADMASLQRNELIGNNIKQEEGFLKKHSNDEKDKVCKKNQKLE